MFEPLVTSLSLVGVLLLRSSYGLNLEQEAYNICPRTGTHTFQPLKERGIIEFESLDSAPISCSVNLQYNYTELSSVSFTFVGDGCSHVVCPLSAKIEIADLDSCPTRLSYTPPLDEFGVLPVKVFGENQPPLKSFILKYETGLFLIKIIVMKRE